MWWKVNKDIEGRTCVYIGIFRSIQHCGLISVVMRDTLNVLSAASLYQHPSHLTVKWRICRCNCKCHLPHRLAFTRQPPRGAIRRPAHSNKIDHPPINCLLWSWEVISRHLWPSLPCSFPLLSLTVPSGPLALSIYARRNQNSNHGWISV